MADDITVVSRLRFALVVLFTGVALFQVTRWVALGVGIAAPWWWVLAAAATVMMGPLAVGPFRRLREEELHDWTGGSSGPDDGIGR